MGRAFDLMGEALLASWRAVQGWWASIGVDPRTWPTSLWIVVGAVAVLVVGVALRSRRKRALPEVLLSHGEVVLVDDAAESATYVTAPVQAPANTHYQLRMTLSNLNAFPLQLLEVAVRTRTTKAPVVAEAAAVVPPHGSVDVVADFFDLPGDAATVEVFLFSTRTRGRTLRLAAPLEWEPWDRRYRIKALALRSDAGRSLASQVRTQRAKRAYQRERLRQRSASATQEAVRRAEDLRRGIQERRAAAQRRRAEAGEALRAMTSATGTGLSVGTATPARDALPPAAPRLPRGTPSASAARPATPGMARPAPSPHPSASSDVTTDARPARTEPRSPAPVEPTPQDEPRPELERPRLRFPDEF